MKGMEKESTDIQMGIIIVVNGFRINLTVSASIFLAMGSDLKEN
jgi:hypothetical protein